MDDNNDFDENGICIIRINDWIKKTDGTEWKVNEYGKGYTQRSGGIDGAIQHHGSEFFKVTRNVYELVTQGGRGYAKRQRLASVPVEEWIEISQSAYVNMSYNFRIEEKS